MTVKDPDNHTPFVPAQVVTDEPDIDINAPSAPAATMVGSSTTSASNPGYKAPASRPTTQATTTTTTYTVPAPGRIPNQQFGMSPVTTVCPNCNQQTRTRVLHQIDGCTIVGVVVLLIFFWPLFWLPLVIPGCKTTEHYCQNCNVRLSSQPPCQ